eukprot:jgi/Psemu1/32614/gm1.32614_g
MGAQPAAYERETTLRSPVIPSTSSPTRPTPPYTILAAFPQLSTSSSVPTIPVTPEMEITLSRPLSKSKRGKVTTSRKRNDKYRMKYIYLSMTRAAAHRYISELASASNLDLRARYVEVGAEWRHTTIHTGMNSTVERGMNLELPIVENEKKTSQNH